MIFGQVYGFVGFLSALRVQQTLAVRYQQLPIDIYYESLCPDSRIFLTKYFEPQYQRLAKYLDVRFIPFGKASINEDGTDYMCQHGKDECVRNIIHICTLNNIHSGLKKMDFVSCAMLNTEIEGQKQCAEEAGVKWDVVDECIKSGKGIKLTLLAQSETKDLAKGPSFVPWINFNKVYSEEDHEIALTNPKQIICKYLSTHYVLQYCSHY